MPATMQEKTTAVSVAPFGIEADHPRNCDLLLQAIPGARLRSAISASRTVIDVKTGEPRIPQDQARHLGQLPPIPGMQIHVNPAKLSYVIMDPLAEDEELCERIRKAMDASRAFRVGNRLRGVPTQTGTLDPHRMKTLVRELVWLVTGGEARVVKGALPRMEDVEELPGKYLLDPGSRIRTSRPIYEEDLEPWWAKLTSTGG